MFPFFWHAMNFCVWIYSFKENFFVCLERNKIALTTIFFHRPNKNWRQDFRSSQQIAQAFFLKQALATKCDKLITRLVALFVSYKSRYYAIFPLKKKNATTATMIFIIETLAILFFSAVQKNDYTDYLMYKWFSDSVQKMRKAK